MAQEITSRDWQALTESGKALAEEAPNCSIVPAKEIEAMFIGLHQAATEAIAKLSTTIHNLEEAIESGHMRVVTLRLEEAQKMLGDLKAVSVQLSETTANQ